MSNWTESDLRAYTTRRLKDESRARERMQQAMSIVAPAPLKEAVKPMVGKKVAGSGNQHNPTVVLAFFRHHGLPEPVPEYRFCERRWRWDWAWPAQRVACEVNGGIFVQGRHNRGTALLAEYEKLSKGAALGWRTLITTPDQLLTAQFASLVREALAI